MDLLQEDTKQFCLGNRLCAPNHTKLLVYPLQMRLDRMQRNKQLVGDLLAGQPGSHQPQHFTSRALSSSS